MLSEEEKYRYNRHLILDQVGIEGQQKLKRSSVLVIGAGGLGCPALMYLAAAGVGQIGIIDFDTVDESNLQRQVLFTKEDIGHNKAKVAAKRLEKLNPFTKFKAYEYDLNSKNAVELFSKYDVILDGSDNFSTRYLVNDASIKTNKPLVFGSLFKFEGQISVFNYKDGPSYRCLFPEPPEAGTVPNCSEIGVLGVVAGIIGSQQANEVLKIILEIGTTLSGTLLVYNSLDASFARINISKNQRAIDTIKSNSFILELFDYDFFCGVDDNNFSKNDIDRIEFDKLIEENTIVLDVRESWEQPHVKGAKVIQIPLSALEANHDKIPKNEKVVVVCQNGMRSIAAISYLKDNFGYENLLNLKGGIENG